MTIEPYGHDRPAAAWNSYCRGLANQYARFFKTPTNIMELLFRTAKNTSLRELFELRVMTESAVHSITQPMIQGGCYAVR